MNFNHLLERVREFLDQLAIHWLVALAISLDEVCKPFRRMRRRRVRKQEGDHPRDGTLPPLARPERVTFFDGDSLALVHLLDPLIITCVRFSPDGKSLACAGSDGTVTILDRLQGRARCVFREHLDWVNSVDWDPAGARLASASLDGTVRVWCAESGRSLFTPIVSHAEVRAVAWSPDGARLAIAGADQQVLLWPIGGDESAIVTCGGHSGQVRALAWSPWGTQLASGSQDGGVRVFDTGSGETLRFFRNAGPVNALAWSPDPESGLVASGSEDRLVKIWNTCTGRCAFTYTGHQGYAGVSACAWSRPARLISADWNETVQEWTLPSETQKAVSIVVPRPRIPLLDTGHIHTMAAYTTLAGTRMALGGDGWLTIGASPAELSSMLGDSCGGRVVLRL